MKLSFRRGFAAASRMEAWMTALVLGPGILVPWIYLLTRPPPPKRCGTRNGPPITADRIRLRDGRYLAYKEAGVPKQEAKFKVVYSHPFCSSRHSVPVSQELMTRMGVYLVTFDRPGYGQSDAFPERSIKSQAEDIEELADQLKLGDKFYLLALSMGGYSAWSCLKHIPHRLAGVAMMAPVLNYWWPGLDQEVARKAFQTLCLGDRITLSIAHHAPWLLHYWLAVSPLPNALSGGAEKYYNEMDKGILEEMSKLGISEEQKEQQKEALQLGIHESLHRDAMVQFGNWDFFPGRLPDKGVRVHIWQGDGDYLVPATFQRHISECLPWVHYEELPGVGHLLDFVPGLCDKVVQSLLTASS